MKIILMIMMAFMGVATTVHADTFHRPYPFDQHGCIRHIKAIAKVVKDAGGEVKKNDGSDMSYQMTINGKTTIYTCTRHELLETELEL